RFAAVDPKTAKDACDHIEKIFLDNKHTKTIALKEKLWMLQLGDLTMDAFIFPFAFSAQLPGLLTITVEVGFFGLCTFLPPDLENMNSSMSSSMASSYHFSNAFNGPLLDTMSYELLLCSKLLLSEEMLSELIKMISARTN
ncbi:hypothetical protein Tco_0930070, partial [Tanacetum coccineum]